MGRGLSDLQQWMLRKALDNLAAREQAAREQGRRDGGDGTDLTYTDVKAGYFQMPLIRTSKEASGWRFKKSKLRNYGAISNAVSRAAWRLDQRGLVRVTQTKRKSPEDILIPMRAEIRLTEKGIDAALDCVDVEERRLEAELFKKLKKSKAHKRKVKS